MQFVVNSPYATQSSMPYATFNQNNPPTCSKVSAGFTVKCSVETADTLRIMITAIESARATDLAFMVTIDNFYTPFSAQVLQTINIRSYTDNICVVGQRIVSLSGLTIKQAELPISSVKLETGNNVLGSVLNSNYLQVTFTPATTMSPNKKGMIEVVVPYQWQVGLAGDRMYNPAAKDVCSSKCFQVTSSGLVKGGDRIRILYDFMTDECVKGAPITFQCRQFYNPITPTQITGFQILIYDNEINTKLIEQTVQPLILDARGFLPATISLSRFQITPTVNIISTPSSWTLTLDVTTVPLMQECYIRFFLPSDLEYNPETVFATGIFIKPDLQPTLDKTDLNIIYRTEDGKIPKSSVVFYGCNDPKALGKTSSGMIQINSITTQKAVMDSEEFSIEIYKDKALTQLIAKSEAGIKLVAKAVQPGTITDMSLKPSDQRVQRVNDVTLGFTISHALFTGAGLQVTLPQKMSVAQNKNEVSVILPDKTAAKGSAILTQGGVSIITIPQLTTKTINANTALTIVIKDIKNQDSVVDAGIFTITTLNNYKGKLYTVDSSNSDGSFIATPGSITSVGLPKISDPTNSAKPVIYTLTFTSQDSLPDTGYLRVQLPIELKLDVSTTQSSGSCRTLTCTSIFNTTQGAVFGAEMSSQDSSKVYYTVEILFVKGFAAEQQVSVDIGGVVNPRSFLPTSNFVLTTLAPDRSAIDMGYNMNAVTTIAGVISSFNVQSSNLTNGGLNTLTFSVQANIPLVPGDQITFTLPIEIGAPSIDLMVCKEISNLKPFKSCYAKGQQITIEFSGFVSPTSASSWSISGFKNAPSTKPTSPFTNIRFMDATGYTVSKYDGPAVILTNKDPAYLSQFDIQQDDLKYSAETTYTLSFTPINPLSASASILVQYPSQVSLVAGQKTGCTVRTISDKGPQDFTTNCQIDVSSRSIIITNVFSGTVSYSRPITIILQKVKNPENNKPKFGFVIQTYNDAEQVFIQDRIDQFQLMPQFDCDYPCQSCNGPSVGQRSICKTCWMTSDDPFYLQSYKNGSVTCKQVCDFGSTTNGNQQKICQPCDPSCSTCQDNSTVGDYKQCIDCSPNFPFRLTQTSFCTASCTLGLYNIPGTSTCGYCVSPCQGCKNTEATCTSCFRNSTVPNLFQNRCIDVCPIGYVSVDGICLKCDRTCATCSDVPENCDTCGGGTKFWYKKRCYNECPAGSGPNSENGTCFPCEPGCDLCDIQNKTKCLRCTKPRVVYQGDCLDACPEGWHINKPPGDGSACRPWQLVDLGILPYPYIIAAIIFTGICLFGLMKKRAYLSKGKMVTECPQNTLTCIIVALAPLQFLAIISQWILGFVYGTNTFAILPLVVMIEYMIVNISYQIWFNKWFNSTVIPMEIDRRVRLGKMTKQEAQKHKSPKDEKFDFYMRQNVCTTKTVFTLTCLLSFKFNKLFYSFFYDMKTFQAQFSNAKYYRKMMTLFQIIHLVCVDLALICIDITTLSRIDDDNQFFINVVETLILSIFSIVLGFAELWRLKESLHYTESAKDKSLLKLQNMVGDSDEKDLDKKYDKDKMSERRALMGDILKKVKHYKQLFLNNKLDELLQAFGDRKCKSMLDLGTGWALEDDPRLVITWPISPMLREDYLEMGEIKFTKEDKYGAFANNVYADAKSKFMGMEHGTQHDPGFLEFQDALNRKHGGLMSQQEGDLEERRIKKRKRRRGRKNKYYAQIDHEDDQEADVVEASDNDDLQVIKEQEEEEENMRKAVAQEAKRQQEAALLRKKQLEEEMRAKQAQEIADAEARKKRSLELEAQAKQAAAEEAARAAKNAIESKKLLELAEKEKKAKIAEDKKKAEELAKLSAANRVEYEKQEAARLQALKLEKERLAAELEVKRKEGLEKEKLARLQAIEDAKRLQAEKDAKELREKQDAIRAVDNERAASKIKNNKDQKISPEPQMNKTIQVADDLLEEFKNLERPIEASGQVNTVNDQGRKNFDKSQLAEEEDLSNLLNYQGKSFDIKDIMGNFTKDQFGKIQPKNTKNGLVDNLNRRVSDKGYLIDAAGNIINQNNAQIWRKEALKKGEFPRIFPHTKFDISQILGDIEFDGSGNPILSNNKQQGLIDNQQRRVNQRGYLVDKQGNVINQKGEIVFELVLLGHDGEIPPVFRSGKLKMNSAASYDKLMQEIEQSDVNGKRRKDDGETSLDSQMEDTPANYNNANQRFDGEHQATETVEEDAEYGEHQGQASDVEYGAQVNGEIKKKKKKKKKMTTIEVLQPTNRDKSLAGAYGGQAVGSIRRVGVKYDKERLEGAKKFRVNTAEEPQIRAKLTQLVASNSGMQAQKEHGRKSRTKSNDHSGDDKFVPKEGGFMGKTIGGDSQEDRSQNSRMRNKMGDSIVVVEKKDRAKKGANMQDFEEIFGKDIDQFLEDSDWEMNSNGKKVKQLEKKGQRQGGPSSRS